MHMLFQVTLLASIMCITHVLLMSLNDSLDLVGFAFELQLDDI